MIEIPGRSNLPLLLRVGCGLCASVAWTLCQGQFLHNHVSEANCLCFVQLACVLAVLTATFKHVCAGSYMLWCDFLASQAVGTAGVVVLFGTVSCCYGACMAASICLLCAL